MRKGRMRQRSPHAPTPDIPALARPNPVRIRDFRRGVPAATSTSMSYTPAHAANLPSQTLEPDLIGLARLVADRLITLLDRTQATRQLTNRAWALRRPARRQSQNSMRRYDLHSSPMPWRDPYSTKTAGLAGPVGWQSGPGHPCRRPSRQPLPSLCLLLRCARRAPRTRVRALSIASTSGRPSSSFPTAAGTPRSVLAATVLSITQATRHEAICFQVAVQRPRQPLSAIFSPSWTLTLTPRHPPPDLSLCGFL